MSVEENKALARRLYREGSNAGKAEGVADRSSNPGLPPAIEIFR